MNATRQSLDPARGSRGMVVLWCAVAALCAAWVCGDAVLNLVVAPRLFALARSEGPGDAFAGLVFGDILGRWVVWTGLLLVIPAVCLLAAAAGRALKRHGPRAAGLPLACSLLLLSGHVVSTTTVSHGLDWAQRLREHPDPAQMDAFKGAFHRRAALVFSLEMLAALGVAAGAAAAAARNARPLPGPPTSRSA